MSAFSKLRWYARKPVAVIMAASLVTSTVPVVNLMEAAPAYAAPSERSKVPKMFRGTSSSLCP